MFAIDGSWVRTYQVTSSTGLGDWGTNLLPAPYLPISLSPYLPISLSPYLPISLSPYLPISLSPYLPISLSPYLPISPAAHLHPSFSNFR